MFSTPSPSSHAMLAVLLLVFAPWPQRKRSPEAVLTTAW